VLFLNDYQTVSDWQRENIVRYRFVGRGGVEYTKHLLRTQRQHSPTQDHLTYSTLDQKTTLY